MNRTFVFERFLFSLVLWLAVTTSVWAEPVVTEKEVYYDIHGNTAEQLISEMHHKSGHTNGCAFTSWPVDWTFGDAQTPQGFVVTRLKVKLAITYKYPRWADEAQAPGELRRKWAAWESTMVRHEHGHGDIAKAAARAVEQTLMAVPPKKDARVLGWAANAAAKKTMADYVKKEGEYDRVTKFKGEQGSPF